MEVELKFLGLDIGEIEDKIIKLGAVKKYDTNTKSVYFHNDKIGFSFPEPDKNALRLRAIDENNILTVKYGGKESTMRIREEVEIEVDDFEKTRKILEIIGFKESSLLYKKRKHYEWKNIYFEIDQVGDNPPFLEIETQSEEQMHEVCKQLGLDITKGDKRTWLEIYPEATQ